MTPFESLEKPLKHVAEISQILHQPISGSYFTHLFISEVRIGFKSVFEIAPINRNRYFPSRLIFCHLLSRITFIEFLSQSYRNMYYFSLLLKFENRGIWTLIMNFKMTDNLRSVIVFQLELDQLDEKITGTGYAIFLINNRLS